MVTASSPTLFHSMVPLRLHWLLLLLLLLGSTVSFEQQCSTTRRQRKAWSKLSSLDQQDLLAAVTALKNHNPRMNGAPFVTYDDFVVAHAVNTFAAHSIDAPNQVFLLWHRWFLYQFETALQMISNNPCITLPYWEWEVYSGNEASSAPLDESTFGSVNGVSYKRYRGVIQYAVTEGIAAQGIWSSSAVSREIFPNGHLERDFALDMERRFTSQAGLLDRILRLPTFQDFFLPLEGAPHAIPHNYVGRMMSNVFFSPEDPLFFLHHCNVDRIFAMWQDFYDHDLLTADELGYEQYSSSLDTPMPFGMANFSINAPFFYFNDNAFPTPRQVLLLNPESPLQVQYAEDTLAQLLSTVTAGTYSPNPDWFTFPSSDPTPAPTPAPSCNITWQTCSQHSDCCSGLCKFGFCKGRNNNGTDVRTGGVGSVNGGGVPTWASPFAQSLWETLWSDRHRGTTKPPTNVAAEIIHQIAVEECPAENPVEVTQEWMDQTGMDPSHFRCHIVV